MSRTNDRPILSHLPWRGRAWRSLTEMLATLPRCAGSPKKSNAYLIIEPDRLGRFHDTLTFTDAVKLAQNGWPQGLERIKKARSDLKLVSPREPAFTTFYDTSGSYPDVGRFLEGDPEHMIDFAPTTVTRRVLRLAVHASFIGTVEAETVAARGACIANIIDILEARNIRVEVTAVSLSHRTVATGCGPCYLHDTLVLKEADEPLDLDRLAFTLMHVDMFRRLFGAAREMHKGVTYGLDARTVNLTPELVAEHGYDCYIPSAEDFDEWNNAKVAEYVNILTPTEEV